tara:strand:- start:9225 stop:10028 length:804 start_codon:yes stop_codon:yes gene_type:complete
VKIIYFDLEHGSQTLGGKEDIEELFGYPLLAPNTWDAFNAVLGKLYTKKKHVEVKRIGGLEIPEESIKIIPRENTDVDALIIDTFSELSKKYMRSLVNERTGTMKLQDWGKLKNALDILLEKVTRIPKIVICNVHAKLQTMDDGANKILPYIDGSTKEDISKWFDFVVYTKAINKKTGTEYRWVTERTETYDHAKDRTQILEPIIEQDFQLILDAARSRGFDGCKVLVIGSPGSGKTFALKTLVRPTKPTTTNDKKKEEEHEQNTHS